MSPTTTNAWINSDWSSIQFNYQDRTLLENRKREFIQMVDKLFYKTLEARESSKIEQMKSMWSRNKLTRFVAGAGLATWAIVATASWAFLVAGGLLGARAAIWAIGWYLLCDSSLNFVQSRISTDKYMQLLATIQSAKERSELNNIIDDIFSDMSGDFQEKFNEAKKKQKQLKKINMIASWATAAAFAIFWWASAAEAATEGLVRSTTLIESTHNKVLGILDNSSSSQSPISISDIFQDIHHDHPTQWYITLEQAVRRIEWLKMGIWLDESEKLNWLNRSIYTLVRDNNWSIMKTMKELWILTEGQSLDDVASHLTESQIQQIVEKTYSLQDISPSWIVPTIPTWEISEVAIPTQSPSISPSSIPEPNINKSPSWMGKLLWGWIGLWALAGLWWIIRRRMKNKNEKIVPVIKTENTISVNIPSSWQEWRTNNLHNSD